jgi:L,D-transpeptidase catalytic domain
LTAVRSNLVAVVCGSLLLMTTGCAAFQGVDKSDVGSGVEAATQSPTTVVTTTAAPAPVRAPATTVATTPAPTVATTPAPVRAAPTTTAPPTTPPPTTTIPLPPDVFDPACVRVIQRGESLSLIADAYDDPTVTARSLAEENGIGDADAINFGELLDVCPGNKIDDISGDERGVAEAAVGSSGVAAQQSKLNELFAGYGLPQLAVDGVSGPFTRQQLCAARMALHLPISRADMAPGSEEERTLLSAQSIAIPADAAVASSRWVVVDKTCQIMFAGEGSNGVKFVFKVSTGEPGWETSNQEVVRAFRYDPALENDGWHNSTKFPAAEDNPLNGNMYRPIYFHRGQAIHGANNVPPEPASKGCVRVRPENQDALIAWLGLGDVDGPTYNRDRINLAVSVHGEYQPG